MAEIINMNSSTNNTTAFGYGFNSGFIVSRSTSKWGWIKNIFAPKKSGKYTIDEFFTVVKEGLKSTNIVLANRLSSDIKRRFEVAKASGQEQLLKKLGEMAEGMRKEIRVVEKFGDIKYVSDKAVNDVMQAGINGRSVYCSPIKNYDNPIPDEPLKKIISAKESELFDDIVILYTRLSEQPKELDKSKKKTSFANHQAGKDPIAFGRINGNDRLYFIADWIDDECDLTLSKLEKHMPKFSVKKLVPSV